jgi:uncharacterized membrane protein YphA (DoxX/SURF4 family)
METVFYYLPTVGQILIGLYFTYFAIWNIYHWRPTIDVMLEDHIPSPVFFLSLGLSCQIILGVMIMCNIHIKIAALLLIIFTIFSLLMFHPFWKFKGDRKKHHMAKFIDNLTMNLGALILLLNMITPITNLSDLLS